jgi:NAD(P)H-dependent FMN reductase
MKVLTICGSLRENSSNASILKAVQLLHPFEEWDSFNLFILPYFQPELQFEQTPHVVENLRSKASQSDLILISTPEYAHGLPGVLKNGLEWMFCEGTMKKPVAVIIGSGQGEATQSQLVEILNTMDFIISKKETLLIPGARTKLDHEGVILDEDLKLELTSFLARILKSNS